MRAKAVFRDHPLHSMLVAIPLGAFPTAFVFDVLHVVMGDSVWYAAAHVAGLVGLLGILAAIVPGLIDFNDVVPREGSVWRRATSHLVLGFAVLAYFGGLAVYRWLTLADPDPRAAWIALGANALGNAALGLQGFWGGELVTRHRVSVHGGEGRRDEDARPRRSRGEIRGGGSP